jgi:hypothetical protein
VGTSRRTDTDVGTLQTVLASARAILDELCRDGQLNRLVDAFLMLPEADRQPILRVIERDATWRRIVEETAGTTGISVRPNPHASLYVHVFDESRQPVEPAPLARDVEVIRIGIERFVQLLPLFFQEGVHRQWTASARELIRDAPPELRSLGRRLIREVEALIAEAGDAEQ